MAARTEDRRVGERRRRALAAVVVVGACAVFQLGAMLLDDWALARVLWSDVWWTVVSLAAGLKCIQTARRRREHHLRLAYLAFGIGCLSWFAGMLVWDINELILGRLTPFPSLAEIGFWGLVPAFVFGFVHYKADHPSAALTLKHCGDLCLIACVIVVCSTLILWGPATNGGPKPSLGYLLAALTYPVLHVSALLFGMLCLWQHVWGRRRWVLAMHMAGLSLLAATTTLYANSLLLGTYQTGNDLDITWIACFLIVGWAAFEEDWLGEVSIIVDESERAPERTSEYDALVPSGAIAAVVIVAVAYGHQWVSPLLPIVCFAGAGVAAGLGLRVWASQRLERQLRSQVLAEEARARRLEAQLVHAQKMEAVGALAGGVAHDFNNLLQAMVASVSLARRKQARGADLSASLDEIEQCLWKAADMTSRLLAVARKREPQRAMVKPREAVAQVAQLLAKVLPRNVELHAPGMGPRLVGIDEPLKATIDDVRILVDPGGLDHALLNLGLNARDAMRERGGVLSLDVRRVDDGSDGVPGPAIVISVVDSGTGIAPQHLPRIFEPFFTTKAVGEGTGLGLAMVDAFAAGNGGAVGVTSRLGDGTTFRLVFPAVAESSGSASDALPTGDETVMIVDLGDISGLAATGVLERCGYQTVVADSVEAVAALGERAARVELVVADAALASGRRLVTELRQIGCSAPIILVAGEAADPIGDWAAVVRKPIDPRTLATTVRAVLDRRSRAA